MQSFNILEWYGHFKESKLRSSVGICQESMKPSEINSLVSIVMTKGKRTATQIPKVQKVRISGFKMLCNCQSLTPSGWVITFAINPIENQNGLTSLSLKYTILFQEKTKNNNHDYMYSTLYFRDKNSFNISSHPFLQRCTPFIQIEYHTYQPNKKNY